MRILKLFAFIFGGILLFFTNAECQTIQRINGLTPMKWITIKHSISPNRVLQYNGQNYSADFEDIHAKIWIPLILARQVKVAAGAFYRTEQIETKGWPGSEFSRMNHWNLRSAGIELKAVAQLSDRNSLIIGTNLSHSATIQSLPLRSSPVNFALSGIFMQRKSDNKEIGFGLLYSNNMNNLPCLPIIVWNETFNKRNGIEVSLPYKLAWRHNLSDRSILHFKTEGISRSYFIDQPNTHQCRRIDVDLGVAYTRLINKWMGFEFFGGCRENISSDLPDNISLKTRPSLAISTELFLIPGFHSTKRKR
jgi:hypothetical protein